MPRISIVIASRNSGSSLLQCLQALASVSENGAEVIVVDNSAEVAEVLPQSLRKMKLIRAGKEKLIPQLWEIGIQHASGDIVALTTAHFVPENDWVHQILRAHEGPHAGIGGAIENEPHAGIVSRAIYFCRYSAYMLPFTAGSVKDFAADNASYKRAALDKYETARSRGFWEAAIHAQMVKDGLELSLDPRIVVRHHQSFSFLGFMRQRFLHGRQYGADRAKDFSMLRRLAHIVSSPLIPAIFLWRITRRVMTRKRSWGEYLPALPVMMLFLLSWAAGELLGYLSIPVAFPDKHEDTKAQRNASNVSC
jgi:glycosyltransferase involved in cell wall biosynthesis